MSMSIKKRLVLGAGALTTVGAAATLVAGVTFGFFSATTTPQGNTFAAGTVTLAQSAVHTCAVTPMSPGDGTTAGGGTSNNATEVQCSFTVTYGGSVPAYIGLDVAIASKAAGVDPNGVLTPGAPGLFDGTATGLQVLIQGGGTKFMNSDGTQSSTTAGTILGGSATPTDGTGSANNMLVSNTASNSGDAVTFTVDYNLPTGATNAYQGAASSITLTAHATQASNNSASGCTVGQTCGIAWS